MNNLRRVLTIPSDLGAWHDTFDEAPQTDVLHDGEFSKVISYVDRDGLRRVLKRPRRLGPFLERQVDAMYVVRNHPSCVRMINFDLRTIEMEDEGTKSWVRYCGVWSEKECRIAAKQLLSALMALHTHGFLHRRVTPDNVLVNYRGVSKLSGFGGACKADWTMTMGAVPLWYSNEFMATPTSSYDRYGTEVDVWAAVCCVAELVSGRVQFPGKNFKEQAKLVKAREWTVEGPTLKFVTDSCDETSVARVMMHDWVS